MARKHFSASARRVVVPVVNEGKINTLDQWASGADPFTSVAGNYPFYLSKIDRALTYGGAPALVQSQFAAHSWKYADIAAIYAVHINGSSASTAPPQLPQYVLHQEGGTNYLYLSFYSPADLAARGTTNEDGLQFSADPGLQTYRDYYQNTFVIPAKNLGHAGTMMDDVNPASVNARDASGNVVGAHDARTNTAMTGTDWSKYLAEHIEQLKANVSGTELVANMHWFTGANGNTRQYSDPNIARIIAAADWILLENPLAGTGGGTGQFSLNAMLDTVDHYHTVGTGAAYFNYSNIIHREYQLAVYFLTSVGYDYVGVTLVNANPSTYNPMYDFDLGQAQGQRYTWNNLLRRDFANGFVLVNQPSAATVNVSLGGSFLNTAGQTVTTASIPGQVPNAAAVVAGQIFRNP